MQIESDHSGLVDLGSGAGRGTRLTNTILCARLGAFDQIDESALPLRRLFD